MLVNVMAALGAKLSATTMLFRLSSAMGYTLDGISHSVYGVLYSFN